MKHREKNSLYSSYWGKRKRISFFGLSLCASLLCTKLQMVASHFINWQTPSPKHFQEQSYSFLRFTQWFLLRFTFFHTCAENKLASTISPLVLWEVLIIYKQLLFLGLSFFFLQLSWLWLFSPLGSKLPYFPNTTGLSELQHFIPFVSLFKGLICLKEVFLI